MARPWYDMHDCGDRYAAAVGLTPFPSRLASPATACLCAPLPPCFLLAHRVFHFLPRCHTHAPRRLARRCMEPSECCRRTCWEAGWRGSGDESGSYQCPATAEARDMWDTHDCGDRCTEQSECCHDGRWPSPSPEPSPSPGPCDDVCPVGLCDHMLDGRRATPVHGVPPLLPTTYTPISGRGVLQ